MWLTQRILGNNREHRVQTGPVSLSGEGFVFAQGAGEARDLPVFAPYGFCSIPPDGEQALMLPVGEGYVCVGVRSQGGQLLPGEVMLSACGGYIHLKQDGSVEINGLVITPQGQVIPG